MKKPKKHQNNGWRVLASFRFPSLFSSMIRSCIAKWFITMVFSCIFWKPCLTYFFCISVMLFEPRSDLWIGYPGISPMAEIHWNPTSGSSKDCHRGLPEWPPFHGLHGVHAGLAHESADHHRIHGGATGGRGGHGAACGGLGGENTGGHGPWEIRGGREAGHLENGSGGRCGDFCELMRIFEWWNWFLWFSVWLLGLIIIFVGNLDGILEANRFCSLLPSCWVLGPGFFVGILEIFVFWHGKWRI